MSFLILNGLSYPQESSNRQYRGTDRRMPTHCDAVPDDHEINRLFRWFLKEGGESGLVHDLLKARRYADLCNQYCPGKHFEVIEVTDGEMTPEDPAHQLLGFDISANGCGSSLISVALLYEPAETMPEEPILVLTDLIREHFRPKLNEFGLFRTFEDASHCRRAMIALQSFHPNLYEGGDLEVFTVAGIYLVPQSHNGTNLCQSKT